jgi:ribosomal 30S subunit maturation factor RimM
MMVSETEMMMSRDRNYGVRGHLRVTSATMYTRSIIKYQHVFFEDCGGGGGSLQTATATTVRPEERSTLFAKHALDFGTLFLSPGVETGE